MHGYQNMSLAKKLFLAFIIIAAIGMVIGIIGISGMARLNKEDQEMYDKNTLPMLYLAEMYDTLASQRICANNMVIFRDTNPEFSKEEAEALTEKEYLFDNAFKNYSTVLSDDTEQALYDNISRLYYNDFKTIKANVKAVVDLGDSQAMAEAIYAMDDMGSNISDYMDKAFEYNIALASEKVQTNKELYKSSYLLQVFAMIVGAVIAIVFAVFLNGIITRPLGRIKNATRQVAETGNLKFSEDAKRAIMHDAQYADETGQVANAFAAMMEALTQKTAILETVASGDLTPDVPLASSQDTIGNAIVLMLDNLNDMFAEINNISNQVAASSGNVARGAQMLSQGASEQASTIGEISSSISDIVSQSDISAQTSDKASATGEQIRVIATEGSEKMGNMMNAVQEIHDASRSIEKVIKSIDDIAFQTNILALNAAVEAARAGQHGKGFAVVADEVRNLAAKSAEAAKETSALITANITKTELGLSISNDTSESFQQIVDGIQATSALLQTMAEQTSTISTSTMRLSSSIDQVAQVVQQNSAASEQSAASSQEMSGQAQTLRQLVSRFHLRDSGPQNILKLSAHPSYKTVV